MEGSAACTGIVLAAGLGTRLRPLTDELPKCLLPVGGRPLLLLALASLWRSGVRHVVVVAGYRSRRVRDAVRRAPGRLQVTVAEAPAHRRTGTAESLRVGLAAVPAGSGVVVLEGDVVAEDEVLRRVLATPAPATAVASGVPGCTGTFLEQAGGVVTAVSHASWRPREQDTARLAKAVNVHALGRRDVEDGFRRALAATLRRDPAASLEHALATWIAAGARVAAVEVGDLRWWEVDDAADLAVARRLFPAAPGTVRTGPAS